MAEAGYSRESAEYHGRSDFFSGKGAAATGIWKAWRDQGRVGGGEHRQQRIGARQGTSILWDGDR